MKTIGLIGGMSWESSSEYYKINVLCILLILKRLQAYNIKGSGRNLQD